jgi:hypothetical protein
MSYGQNAPWGMQTIKSITGAPWTGQANPYPIASGYAQNIFNGDLVFLDNTGSVRSYYDLIRGAGTYVDPNVPAYPGNPQTLPALGVAVGFSYATANTSAVDYASPGRPYWPAGTLVADNTQAVCYVVDDPNAIYNIQAGTPGFTLQNVNQMVGVNFSQINNIVQGDFKTGQSLMYADIAAGVGVAYAAGASNTNGYPPYSALYRPLMIQALVNVAGNNSGDPYNNAEVFICNHAWRKSSIGH